MSFMENGFARDVVISVTAAVVGAGLAYLIHDHFNNGESPILVRDGGSIELQSGGETLNTFPQPDEYLIYHPNGRGVLDKFTSNAGLQGTCPGNRRCWVVVTYNDAASSTLTISSGGNGRGMWVRSSIPLASWDRSNPANWILQDPGLKIRDAKVYGTNQADGTPICSAPGCEVVAVFPR